MTLISNSSLPEAHQANHTYGSYMQALGLVFLILAVFSIVITVQTGSLTRRTEASVLQSDLYESARYHITVEESLERKYRVEPGRNVLADHISAGQKFDDVLRAARTASSAAERHTLDLMLMEHGRYVQATHEQLFPAVDAHNAALTLAVDHQLIDPVFDHLKTQLAAAAQRHHQNAQDLLAQLAELENRLAGLTPAVFLIGLLTLVLVAIWFRRLQNSIDQANHATLQRLAHEATIDSLTGLQNHRAFKEALVASALPSTLSGQPLTLVRIDLDDFKSINDRYGHLHGDQILGNFGKVLGQAFPGQAYRVGGDEFAVLLRKTNKPAVTLLEELRTSTQQEGHCTVSVGVATRGKDISNLDDLHQQADQALYEAKRRGRNRVLSFADVAARAVLLPQEHVQALRELLADRQMGVAFQPILSGNAGQPVAYEALARPPQRQGAIGPEELFDVAARLNHAADLDELCWTSAFHAAASLPPHTLLFINLSPQTLDQDELLAPRLLKAVQTAGLSPAQVVFEITERSVGQVSAIVAQVHALRVAGFQIALDDLGAGNAGLEMMQSVEADFVKLDRSVVNAAMTNPTARGVMAAVMAFANETGVRVIVEGIETAEMLGHTRSLGDTWAQGYYLGRPLGEFLLPLNSEDQPKHADEQEALHPHAN